MTNLRYYKSTNDKLRLSRAGQGVLPVLDIDVNDVQN